MGQEGGRARNALGSVPVPRSGLKKHQVFTHAFHIRFKYTPGASLCAGHWDRAVNGLMWPQFFKTEAGEADIHPLVTIVTVIREITPLPTS